MMHKLFWTCGLILGIASLSAQVQDDFSDGNFTANPAWSGETTRFQVSPDFALQSNGQAANDEIYLTTPSSQLNATEWRIRIGYDFAPSTSNLIRYYLVSDQPDLEGPLNGYFVGVGETGSDDSYDLYRQDGTAIARIIDGVDGRAGTEINGVIRVLRDNTGNWELSTDLTQSGQFQAEGSIFDDTYTSTAYVGLWVKHSSTRNQSFFFDDIYVGGQIQDTVAPMATELRVLSAQSLQVVFSEPVETNSAELNANYLVDPGIGNPLLAEIEAGNPRRLSLTFGNAFQQNTTYQLTVDGVQDLAGNAMAGPQTLSFLYLEAEAAAGKEVIFNELMPDPSPVVGLPETEFVELFNRSGKVINLGNWTLDNGTTQGSLPNWFLLPGEYVVLTRAVDTALFSGPVLGLSSWPALVNTGDELRLTDETGSLIDSLAYELTWYGDPAKEGGGYSLELIRPDNLDCPPGANWQASQAAAGGTPGQANSLFNPNPETTAPQVNFAQVANANEILLCFDESMDPAFLTDPGAYALTPFNGLPTVVIQGPEARCVILRYLNDLELGIEYTLTVNNVADCSGNLLVGPVNLNLLLGEPVESGTLSLTEIFADGDPSVGLPNVEYVEIFNLSSKALDLTGLRLADASSTGTVRGGVLKSGEYAILSSEEDSLALAPFGQVVVLSSFPSLNNSFDSLYLATPQGELLEFAFYESSWFGDPEKASGGWSLEKINPLLSDCYHPDNWTASVDAKGGTPGQLNSINGAFADQLAPQVLSVSLPQPNQVLLRFSDQMNPDLLRGPATYTLTPDIGAPLLVSTVSPHYQQARLVFDSDLVVNVVYQLRIEGMEDCTGNRADTTILLGLPVAAEPGDVLINEILFNPFSGGADFVEIYNASANILNLADLVIGEGVAGLDTAFNTDRLSDQLVPFLPGQLLCLTRDVAFQQMTYLPPESARFWSMSGFPSYDDAAGNCVILNAQGQLLDQFAYFDDFHYPTLTDDEGVSLERISLRQSAADPSNWHSAAATVRYATPGYANSQAYESDPSDETVQLSPQTFSPNDDGIDDVLAIAYQFPFPGANARISVFDTQGRLIKLLQPNILLSPEAGTFFWDGTDSKNTRADIGMYVVVVEVSNQNTGKKEIFRRVCVLADRF